jgi:hypothetical protein
MKRFYYEVGPIDFWDGWTRLNDFLASPKHSGAWDPSGDRAVNLLAGLISNAVAAGHSIADMSNIRDVYVSGAPMPDGGSVFLAVKIDNDGTTFISSPVELPWLREGLLRPKRVAG